MLCRKGRECTLSNCQSRSSSSSVLFQQKSTCFLLYLHQFPISTSSSSCVLRHIIAIPTWYLHKLPISTSSSPCVLLNIITVYVYMLPSPFLISVVPSALLYIPLHPKDKGLNPQLQASVQHSDDHTPRGFEAEAFIHIPSLEARIRWDLWILDSSMHLYYSKRLDYHFIL